MYLLIITFAWPGFVPANIIGVFPNQAECLKVLEKTELKLTDQSAPGGVAVKTCIPEIRASYPFKRSEKQR